MFSWKFLKFVCEYVPFTVFFLTYKVSNMFFAVAIKLITAVICLTISYLIDYKLSKPLLFSSILVFIFGIMTLFFNDSAFVMIQPTILYVIMGSVSVLSAIFNVYITRYVLDDIVFLSDRSHKFLSYSGALVMFFLAVLNEFIRLHYSENEWVNYKLIVFPVATIILLIFFLILAYIFVFTKEDIRNLLRSNQEIVNDNVDMDADDKMDNKIAKDFDKNRNNNINKSINDNGFDKNNDSKQ